jgi:hypothetical protein
MARIYGCFLNNEPGGTLAVSMQAFVRNIDALRRTMAPSKAISQNRNPKTPCPKNYH